MSKRDLSTRIARWALQLDEFDYDIEHRMGSKMQHVDALSRFPIMLVEKSNVLVQVRRSQGEDVEIKAIKEKLDQKSYERYSG